MNSQPPDHPGAPDRPTPEAWAVRADWRGEPPSEAHESAERALSALSRAAGEGGGGGAVDVPPVPGDLRSRWAEMYGRPAAGAEEVRPRRPESEERRESGFLEWLRGIGRPGRLAWVGGAGAVAAVLIVASQFQGGPGESSDPDTRVRGSGTGVPPGDPAPIAMVAPTPAASQPVLAMIKQAFPVRDVRVLASANEAAAMALSEPRLVVVNLASGLVTAWSNGALHQEFPAGAAASPGGVVVQIESADESLEKQGASP